MALSKVTVAPTVHAKNDKILVVTDLPAGSASQHFRQMCLKSVFSDECGLISFLPIYCVTGVAQINSSTPPGKKGNSFIPPHLFRVLQL